MKENQTTENTETREDTQVTEQPRLPELGTEDLAAENESLKAELRMRATAYDMVARLAKAGARSPNLLTERSKDSFQFDDDGKLTNADAILDELKRTYPEQFSVPSIDASAGRTPRPILTKEALARMTPAEIQRLDWAEVKAALAS